MRRRILGLRPGHRRRLRHSRSGAISVDTSDEVRSQSITTASSANVCAVTPPASAKTAEASKEQPAALAQEYSHTPAISRIIPAGSEQPRLQRGRMALESRKGEADMPSTTAVIHSDPDILGGTPVFVGTRVPFRNLIDYLERNHSLEEFLDSFPTVSREQAVAALEAAHEALTARAHSAR
jgi:uncharacterized protein (DUF433 family)